MIVGIIRRVHLKPRITPADVKAMMYAERNAGAYVLFEHPKDVEQEMVEAVRRDGILHTDYRGIVHEKRDSDESSD